MSNEYEDDNKLASLPTFKSNPGKRSETVQDAPPVARPSLWESATMADVRDSIEVLAREPRLSVQSVTDAEWKYICRLGGVK